MLSSALEALLWWALNGYFAGLPSLQILQFKTKKKKECEYSTSRGDSVKFSLPKAYQMMFMRYACLVKISLGLLMLY